MNKMMIVLAALVSFNAYASGPADCIYAKNIDLAFEKNVLAAMRDAKVKGATLEDIQQTSNDYHDPEYNVTVGGKTYHVTCDDSGDGQCGCEVAN